MLKKRGQWKDGDRITGLRKTKKGRLSECGMRSAECGRVGPTAAFGCLDSDSALRTLHSALDGSSAKISGGCGRGLAARRRADHPGGPRRGQRPDRRGSWARRLIPPTTGGGGRQAGPGQAQALRGAEQAARLVCSRKDEFERPTIYDCCPRNGATCTRWGGWITTAKG